jgi:hypothetical protein
MILSLGEPATGITRVIVDSGASPSMHVPPGEAHSSHEAYAVGTRVDRGDYLTGLIDSRKRKSLPGCVSSERCQ